MMPSDENTTAGNPAPRDQANEDQSTTSANTQGQTLLKALQDLIVQMMDPKQMSDINQIPVGSEGGRLITAFQEFISSIIIRSQSGAQNIVEVSLDEEGSLDSIESEEGTQSPNISSSESYGNTSGSTNSGELLAVLEKPRPTFEDKLLRALREHVSNKMPIRLLYFEPHGSSLQITLLERGALFARLASMVQRGIREEESRPKEGPSDITETEEPGATIKHLLSKYAGYSILSHTWLRTTPGEVTYGDWNKGHFNPEHPGYRKLVNFGKASWKNHGLAFGWIDTVCINKESSTELDESIRSMYNWYSRAAVCITYLSETETLKNMHLDPWFTRGWTLQELLAPRVIKFYNAHWKQLIDHADNDKVGAEVMDQIKEATTISKVELNNIRGASLSRRMQLAATREVTREEDTAYSLMGIFDVSISTAYGEGAPRAFSRLLQAILISSNRVLEILNWAGKLPSPLPHNSSVLPSSPRYYVSRSTNEALIFPWPSQPLTLTHMGLRVPLILMPGISLSQTSTPHSSFGDFSATVDYNHTTGFFKDSSVIPAAYSILDKRISVGHDGWTTDRAWYQLTFAVFNFFAIPSSIILPKICIAIPLHCSSTDGTVLDMRGYTRIQTPEPVVFGLSSKSTMHASNEQFWRVEPGELTKHGMRLTNMYL